MMNAYLEAVEESVKVLENAVHHSDWDDGKRPINCDKDDLDPKTLHMDAEKKESKTEYEIILIFFLP